MSPLATLATVVVSILFLAVVVVLVLNRMSDGGERRRFDLHRREDLDDEAGEDGEGKHGFDFASKRTAHRKSLPGPWNRRR